MRIFAAITVLLAGVLAVGCHDATTPALDGSKNPGGADGKTAIVLDYEKASGNNMDKDPAGTITLAWFQAHKDVARRIGDECTVKHRTETAAFGSLENAVCANAVTAISFEHHYDNTH